MIKEMPKIEKGIKTTLYITSDNAEFKDKEEAKWHEFTVCQLKRRRLTVDIPEHDVLHFETSEQLQQYFNENYGHLTYEVMSDVSTLSFPHEYVIMEEEALNNHRVGYQIHVQPIETFKETIVKQIKNA